MEQRRARVAGWIPIRGTAPGGPEYVGGMVDVSRTGAKLYLTARVKAGDRLPLLLRVPAEPGPVKIFGRIVWAKPDADGSPDTLDARLKLMEFLVRLGRSVKPMPGAWMCGMKFDADADRIAILRLQRHFEEEFPRARKQAFHTFQPAPPGTVLDLGALRPDIG